MLLDSADLPGADVDGLIEQARAEVEHAGALIDEILFLSELESGKEVVTLGRTNALPVLAQVVEELDDAAARAGVERARRRRSRRSTCRSRPRMLRIVAENLVENAIRYAGHGATFTLAVGREDGTTRARRPPTTGSASPPTSCRACSSASGAPTRPAPRAAPASGSRS